MKELISKYITFLKYIISAGISFLIDLSLFSLFLFILKKPLGPTAIIASTIIARCNSSLINYYLNRNNVFRSAKNKEKIDSKTFFEYIALVVIQMCVSAISVYCIYNITHIKEIIIKIFVECILFVANYIIQKSFIFKKV